MKRYLLVLFSLASLACFASMETSILHRFEADHYKGTAIDSPRYEEHYRWSDGTATGQADLLYHATLTISTGTTTTLTLNDGSLTDAFGDVASFARVIALSVVANGEALAIGGTFNGWGSAQLIDEASIVILSPSDTGYPTSAASATITLSNSGSATATAQIWILGKSA